MNRRKRTLLIFGLALLFLAAVTLSGMLCHDAARKTDFSVKNLRPCGLYLFGTDWLGRDMLARTLTGLSMSIRIGLCTAGISACIALTLGIMSAVLGIIALVSLFFAVYETFRNQGQALVKYGVAALFALLFALAGIVLGIMSKMEEDRFYLFSYLGIILNLLAIAGIGFIIYAGVYGI